MALSTFLSNGLLENRKLTIVNFLFSNKPLDKKVDKAIEGICVGQRQRFRSASPRRLASVVLQDSGFHRSP